MTPAMKYAEALQVLDLSPHIGLKRAALRAAYRREALRHHPDKNRGDDQAAERFRRATEAFAVLEPHTAEGARPDDHLSQFARTQRTRQEVPAYAELSRLFDEMADLQGKLGVLHQNMSTLQREADAMAGEAMRAIQRSQLPLANSAKVELHRGAQSELAQAKARARRRAKEARATSQASSEPNRLIMLPGSPPDPNISNLKRPKQTQLNWRLSPMRRR